MLWGAARQWHHRRCNQPMERPHATAKRLEQITCYSRTRFHIDCGDRDGPDELAGRRDRAGNRTPASEEAHGRPGWTFAASASLAEGSRAGWTHNQADRHRL